LSIEIVPLSSVVDPEDELNFIFDRLRDCDAHEIVSVGLTPADALQIAHRAEDDCSLVYINDEPVFVFGSIGSYPHIRHIFGFGTDKTIRVMPAVTRWINEVWKPKHFNNGVTRIEVRLPLSCDHSIKWLSKLGMKPECELDHYSVTGERYVQLTYTKDDFNNVYS